MPSFDTVKTSGPATTGEGLSGVAFSLFQTTASGNYDTYLQATVDVRLVTSGTPGGVRAQATSAIEDAATHA